MARGWNQNTNCWRSRLHEDTEKSEFNDSIDDISRVQETWSKRDEFFISRPLWPQIDEFKTGKLVKVSGYGQQLWLSPWDGSSPPTAPAKSLRKTRPFSICFGSVRKPNVITGREPLADADKTSSVEKLEMERTEIS